MEWTAQVDESLFDDAAVEHVTISSDTPDERPARDTGTATCRFSQSSTVHKETRNFIIFDERFLSVGIEQSRCRKMQYHFDLAFLDPVPSRLAGIAWRWLFATLLMAAVSTIALTLSPSIGTTLPGPPWLTTALLAVATMSTLLMFLFRTRFTLTFRSLHGRAPLVELAAWSPRRLAVQAFVGELQQRAAAARKRQWKDKPRFLRDELRAHFRLWEDGILPDEVYEAAKVRILREHE